jgi:predicted transcriptional regulator
MLTGWLCRQGSEEDGEGKQGIAVRKAIDGQNRRVWREKFTLHRNTAAASVRAGVNLSVGAT